MQLQSRIALSSLILITVFLALLIAGFQFLVLAGLSDIEKEQAGQAAALFSNALDAETDAMLALTYDWAAWDDTYQFVTDTNSEYITSNLVNETFSGSRLNLMIFYDEHGSITYAKAYDYTADLPLGITSEASRIIREYAFYDGSPGDPCAGLVMLPHGPAIIAMHPILMSNDEGPARGMLVIGRYLDDAQMAVLAQRTLLDLAVYDFIDGPDGSAPLYEAGPGKIDHPDVTVSGNQQNLSVVFPLHTISGEPALSVRIELPRDTYTSGYSSMFAYLALLVVLSTFAVFIAYLYLNRSFIERIRNMSEIFSAISRTQDYSRRLPTSNMDELGTLAFSVNGMLDCLEETIQDLIRSQEELAESERRYRHLFESADDAIFILQDGVFSECNSRVLELTGRKKTEVIGHSPDEFAPPIQPDGKNSKILADTVIKRALSGETQRFDWRMARSDGSFFDTEVTLNRFDTESGNLLLAIVRDITRQKRDHERVRFLGNITQQISDMLMATDRNFRITYLNKAFEDHFGYTLAELRGSSPVVLTDDPDAQRVENTILERVGRGLTWEGEIRRKRRDGNSFPCEVRVTPLYDSNGTLYGYVSINRDISTEIEGRSREALALRTIEENLTQLATLNDQIRNPLTVIIGLLDLEEGEEFEKIRQQAWAIDDIVRRLDQGWVESLSIREFLYKHYGIGEPEEEEE